MTLAQAVTLLTKAFRVDLDATIDTSSTSEMTTALMVAAQIVSRDTYFLFTDESALTLVEDQAKYSLYTACADRIFELRAVYVNSTQLYEIMPVQFMRDYPGYTSVDSISFPALYVPYQDSSVRIHQPPNAAAVAGDSWVAGFYEHPVYTYGSNANTELLGPASFHKLIVMKAMLENSRYYVAGESGYKRRKEIEAEYKEAADNFRGENLSRYTDISPEGYGNTRRLTYLNPYA